MGEVKLKFCNHLGDIVKIGGIDRRDFQQDLQPLILDIGKDTKYRTRMAVVRNIHHVAYFLGEEEFKDSQFEKLLIRSYTDPSAAVRKAAVEATKGIVEYFGWNFVLKRMVGDPTSDDDDAPKTDDPENKCMTNPFRQNVSTNYHHRLVAIYFFRGAYAE